MFDFHSHNTIKPFHTKDKVSGNFPNPDHWNEPEYEYSDLTYHKLVDAVYPQIIVRTQSHLEAYYNGKVKCFSPSLYPIEHGFIRSRIIIRIGQHVIGIPLTIIRLFLTGLFVPISLRRLVSAVIGIDPKKFKYLRKRGFNYYDDLVAEYKNLSNQTPITKEGNEITIQFPSSFEELQHIDFDCNLAGLPSVEGAHSFISTSTIPALKNKRRLENVDNHYRQIANVAVENVIDFKRKCPSLLYVTFAHHFYNTFCGHTSSLPALAFNQGKKYYDNGINANGWRMINSLLNRQLERTTKLPRILIDTKHMSYKSRVEYHDFVKTKMTNGDAIPIIQTHTGVSGRSSMRALEKLIHQQDELREQHANVNNQSLNEVEIKDFWKEPIYNERTSPQVAQFINAALNLFDDEIIEIIDSDGLIGIMLDEKRIMGREFPDFVTHSQYSLIEKNGNRTAFLIDNRISYKKAKKELGKLLFEQKYGYEATNSSSDPDILPKVKEERDRIITNISSLRNALAPILCGVFLNQVLYIVNVYKTARTGTDSKNPWDHICIGTDFDGVINPLDAYPTGAHMEEFGNDVVDYWKSKIKSSPVLAEHLGTAITPEVLMEKILWGNSWSWLEKYFSSTYRHGSGQ